VTNRQCDDCHTKTFWIPLTFIHSSPGYPGDHLRALVCTDCHGGNAEAVTWRAPAYQPDCAGCHAGDYKADSHKKTDSATTIRYTVSELRDCTGACHVYTDATFTTIKTRRNGPEHRVTSGSF
jgi:hypothetical protein